MDPRKLERALAILYLESVGNHALLNDRYLNDILKEKELISTVNKSGGRLWIVKEKVVD